MGRTKTKDLTPVSFRLDADVVQELDAYSEKSMIPKTRIVEVAIREYLSKVNSGKA